MDIRVLIKMLTVWFFLWGMMACTSSELLQEDDPYKEGVVPLEIPVTKGVNDSDPDNRIESIRLIVLKNDRVISNKFIGSIPATQVTIEIRDTVPVGNIDYFLIANELSSWNLGGISIGSIAFANDIKNKTISFSAYPIVNTSNTIPMVNHYINLKVESNGDTSLDGTAVSATALGTLERLYAKLTLDLRSKFSELANGGEEIELKKVSVKSLPKVSYLAPNLYNKTADNDYFNGADITLTSSNYSLTTDSFIGQFTVYLPEYRLFDISRRTYISATVALVADATNEREYTIIVGDGIATYDDEYMSGNTVAISDLNIRRNAYYKIRARIKSFDETSSTDLEIVASVTDWNATNVNTTDPEEYFLNISQSEFNNIGTSLGTTSNPYEGVVNVTTSNPNGWKASTKSTGLTILSTGDDKLTFKIAAATSVTSWIIDVTAGKVTKQIKITR